MSGGSYDYLYIKMEDAAETLSNDKNPLRKAFARKLQLFAKAMHDIEWVDSYDYGPGDDEKAIRQALGKNADKLALQEVVLAAEAIKKDLSKYNKANKLIYSIIWRNIMKYPFWKTNVYWRFKGEKTYRYGYPTQMNNGLVRMGRWHGDIAGGIIVDIRDIEVK